MRLNGVELSTNTTMRCVGERERKIAETIRLVWINQRIDIHSEHTEQVRVTALLQLRSK
ncbi:Vng6133h (plasmid) [Halobacterium salinarum NRC-1]|uniref:Spurious ORF n=1 Tax=Halobacterium salinarum (strain ATCC 700922 / JCM 11081 / NRC-1) TaxID=64091 RepID=Q9HI08_HALSA|nr:Vng6133h [Halobacterium salinarum NRC-1]DAC79782.1 TPA_inf: spurious ORF [Halobacterium salinarum NRC-1]